jgi:FemAB-related protein (PEP-CTERM system-associated)
MNTILAEAIEVHTRGRGDLAACLPRLEAYLSRRGQVPLSCHPGWLNVMADGLGHEPSCLEATEGGETRGFLALCSIRSVLFGRYLVSLPYLNYGGPIADDPWVTARLIERAVDLAGRLDVRYLELRQVQAADHPALGHRATEKVHMRRELPATAGALWDSLSSKVRNHVRQGEKHDLTVAWGGVELLPEFHAVFSQNMRDLGTPSYGRALFQSVLRHFPDRSELCVVRGHGRTLAGALLLHGWGVTEVPSASSLRSHNHTNANSVMYWHLLERAIGRGQGVFDFGRSSRDSNTYKFKKQWGAAPSESIWQYHLRHGDIKAARPDNPRYQRLIRIWKRLPVPLTRCIGPLIVRGIP